jgi:hypothetical protein
MGWARTHRNDRYSGKTNQQMLEWEQKPKKPREAK